MLSVVLFLALAAPQQAPAAGGEAAAPWCTDDLPEHLREARTLLERASVGTTRIGGDNAVLAIWRPGVSIRLIAVRNGESRDPAFTVDLVHRNGVNSEYRVNPDEGWVVLGIRTNIRARDTRRGMRPVVYHPFSAEMMCPVLIEAGRRYLDGLIDAAYADLEDAGVPSSAVAEGVVAVMPRNVLFTLLVIEHVTPDEMDELGAQWVTDKTLATIGMNTIHAYDHARSRAGAFGLAQFMPATYAAVRRAYPGANLLRSFSAGMIDHVNAVKAQACLADRSLAVLDDAERAGLLACGREEDLGAFLAASYNGGETRARDAYLYGGELWEEAGYGLLPETVTYVRVFHEVYRYLFP